MQSKQKTALWVAGSNPEFWQMLFELAPDCYDNVAEQYEAIDFDDTEGESGNGEPIELGDYPIRQIPPIKHGFQ